MNWTTVPRGLAALSALTLTALGVASSTANQGCIYDSSLIAQEQSQGSQVTQTCPAADAAPSAEIPPRPAMSDPSTFGESGLSLVFAMQSVDVGVGVGPDGGLTTKDGGLIPATSPQPHIGFDLDNACTCCPGGTSSCIQASDADCDDDAGRDNTGIRLFRLLAGTGQMGNVDVNQALSDGLYGIVIQLTGYNGQLNDRDVTVNVFASNGIVPSDAGASPLHNGNDKWTVDPRYVAGGSSMVGTDCELNNGNNCPAQYSDNAAYVACGVLVAHPTFVPFTFGGRAAFGGTEMALQEPYIVGTLQSTTVVTSGGIGPSWKLVNGSVSGRWTSQALLSNMATIPDPSPDAGGQFICGSDSVYTVLKPFICDLQDIRHTSQNDNLNLACDSISMAFGFAAEPALLGVVAPIPQLPAGCPGPDGGAFYDTCSLP